MRRNAVIVLTVAALAIAVWYLLVPGGEQRERPGATAGAVGHDQQQHRRWPGARGACARSSAPSSPMTSTSISVAGAAPIRGRETLIGMAGRLQPRTAAFQLQFEDVTIDDGAG